MIRWSSDTFSAATFASTSARILSETRRADSASASAFRRAASASASFLRAASRSASSWRAAASACAFACPSFISTPATLRAACSTAGTAAGSAYRRATCGRGSRDCELRGAD